MTEQERVKKNKSILLFFKIVFGLLIAITVFMLTMISIFVEDEESSSKPKPIEYVFNSEWDNSVYQVEDYLEHYLKDPDSYESIWWGKVVKDEGAYTVRHQYRAKNSFGGYVVSDQVFLLDPAGNVVNVTDYNQQ